MNSLFLKMLQARGSEYLTLDKQSTIISASTGATRFSDTPEQLIVGIDVTLAFPELLGLEDVIRSIWVGEMEDFSLTAIARVLPQQPPVYFDIHIFTNPENNSETNKLICLLEDATERRVLEQSLVQNSNETNLLVNRLRIAKNYIDQVVASMADVLIVTNSLGIIKTINQATIDLFGYSKNELIDQSIFLIVRDALIISHKPTKCQNKYGVNLTISFSFSTLEIDEELPPELVYVGRNITELKRQQKHQELQYAIAQDLTTSDTLIHSVPVILETICQHLDWDLGELWMPKYPDSLQLHLVNSWSNPEMPLTELTASQKDISIDYNEGMAGKVWAEGEPDWIIDIADEIGIIARDSLLKYGIHSAFSFPIIGNSLEEEALPAPDNYFGYGSLPSAKQKVLAVMTFFSQVSHNLDLDQLQLMKSIGYQVGQYINRKQAETALYLQQEKTDKLLLNILPESIANRLKENPKTIAETFDDVTVLFADLVGFTKLSSEISAVELVEILNQVFSEFDRLAELYKLEKIKTIGDCYMVAGGLPIRGQDHPEAIANIALHMQEIIAEFNKTTQHHLSLRIGINTGSVIAGVIGLKKFIYDLWGDTVNVASRMESQGVPDVIQVTPATYERLKENYRLLERGTISIKGKGEMKTYILEGRK
jgi:adenylate cyclase